MEEVLDFSRSLRISFLHVERGQFFGGLLGQRGSQQGVLAFVRSQRAFGLLFSFPVFVRSVGLCFCLAVYISYTAWLLFFLIKQPFPKGGGHPWNNVRDTARQPPLEQCQRHTARQPPSCQEEEGHPWNNVRDMQLDSLPHAQDQKICLLQRHLLL